MSEGVETPKLPMPLDGGRRKRASRPKVKTGCTNCKQRRVKCDGKRPSCLRCLKSGRTCEGYTDLYVRADLTTATQLAEGWWECEECGREVNARIWGYTCPDCSYVNVEGREQQLARTEGVRTQELATEERVAAEDVQNVSMDVVDETSVAQQRHGIVQGGLRPLEWGSRWHFCYILILIGVLTIAGSLALALWWSFTRGDVSGGFTMAAYVVAVGGLPLATVQIRHSSKCKCWKTGKDPGLIELEGG